MFMHARFGELGTAAGFRRRGETVPRSACHAHAYCNSLYGNHGYQ